MNYANTIAEMAEQIRAEQRKCDEEKHAMWLEFAERTRAKKEESHA